MNLAASGYSLRTRFFVASSAKAFCRAQIHVAAIITQKYIETCFDRNRPIRELSMTFASSKKRAILKLRD
jgi:hypothetical protein